MKRPCCVCGKECPEWQRNVDGTYTHDHCAKSVASQPDWLVASARTKEGK
jgi:hypothetical protein